MKAIRIHEHGDLDVLSIDEVEIPQPAADEVLIKVKAAALNHLDLWVRRGGRDILLPQVMGSDSRASAWGKLRTALSTYRHRPLVHL